MPTSIRPVLLACPLAHLFDLYPLLLKLLLLPVRTPSVSKMPAKDRTDQPSALANAVTRSGDSDTVDIRAVAQACLEILGRGMGAIA
jgi:hypothetical protein